MALWVDAEAKRLKRSRGAIIESLAEEALQMRLYPGIAFRGLDSERRPWMRGTGFDLWQIVEAWQNFGSVEKLAQVSQLTEQQIRTTLTYYERFPEAIDECIERNRRPLSDLRELYPTFEVLVVDDEDS